LKPLLKPQLAGRREELVASKESHERKREDGLAQVCVCVNINASILKPLLNCEDAIESPIEF
jgi:hypothetical protein